MNFFIRISFFTVKYAGEIIPTPKDAYTFHSPFVIMQIWKSRHMQK